MKKSIFMFAFAIIAMLGLGSCREDNNDLTFVGDVHSKIYIKEKSIPRGFIRYTRFHYETESILKNFSVKGGGDNKISKIDYKVNFKYSYNGVERNVTHSFTELIEPNQAIVTYSNNLHTLNQYFEETEDNKIKVFFAGEVIITAHTQLGKSYTKILTNVPIQIVNY